MPRNQAVGAYLTMLLITSRAFGVEIPPEWGVKDKSGETQNPVRLASIILFKEADAEKRQHIQKDLETMVEWREPRSKFAQLALDQKLIPRESLEKGKFDWLIASVWLEMRLGHLKDGKAPPPIKFEISLLDNDAYLGALKDIVPVKIESTPTDASIIIDGNVRKKTNDTLGLNKNATYKIELKLDGYVDYKLEVYTPKPGGKVEHTFKKS